MFTAENQDYFVKSLVKLGFQPSDTHLELFNLFYEELLKWNEHTNLTRITGEKEFIDKHLLDSLSSILSLDQSNTEKKLKVIDIGTGAGFPLLPLWFFFPHWKISLLDSVKKKLDFISHFSKLALEKYPQYLSAENIEIIHSRAEDLASSDIKSGKAYREKYDLIFSRAVARLSSLIELSLPFIRVGGIFTGMKGSDIEQEVAEAAKIIKRSGGQLERVLKFDLLETGLSRSLIIIKKVRPTPSEFPRKAGIAQKSPIK